MSAAQHVGRCKSWCVYPSPELGLPQVCMYCGMPPVEVAPKPSGLTVFDIVIADRRPATQADIEQLEAVAAAYVELQGMIRVAHGTLTKRIAEIRSKYGLPA